MTAVRSRAPRVVARLVGAAALALLAGCTGVPAGVTPVTGFDARRYVGTWYSIHRLDHRFERGLTNVSARYRLLPDGSVEVVNRGFDREACEWKQVVGKAKFRGEPDVASLKVSFFGPFYGGYHVFALDRERYSHAMISGPNHGYLWILAREPQLAPEVRDALVAQARAAGFRVEELQTVDQSTPVCADGTTAPAAPAARTASAAPPAPAAPAAPASPVAPASPAAPAAPGTQAAPATQ